MKKKEKRKTWLTSSPSRQWCGANMLITADLVALINA